jgi:hypothetical protein
VVHFSCPVQFSKLLEEAVDILRKYPFAGINNVHFEHLLDFVKSHYYADDAPSADLKGILYQVN